MNLKTNLFAILAIFCVVLSAFAVSAADNVDYNVDDAQSVSDEAVSAVPDVNQTEPQNASGEDLDIHDQMVLPPDYAHNEEAMANATNSTNSTNATGHAAGENTANATGNTTVAHAMHATGNPILVLLAVGAVLGGATVLRRKK